MATKKSRAKAHPSGLRMSKLQYALNCAHRGWSVFPLYSAEDGRCGCMDPRCSNVGKHPLTGHGVKEATRDEKTIRAWWEECPDANIGVATGAPSGIAVLDIDPRHGGDDSLRELEKKYGPLPEGPRLRTGGGGQHNYFACSGDAMRNKVALYPGIDVRGDGGYVVGPGSSHKSGNAYIWQHGKTPKDLRLPDMPEWLRTAASANHASHDSPVLDAINDGRRNSTLASLAGTMRRARMTPEAIEAALLEENRLRCNPPLDDAEVSRIAASIGRYEPADGLPSVSPKLIRPASALVFHSGVEIANAVPEEVPWVVRPYIAAGAITDLAGKVKLAGKTTVALAMGRSVIEGSEFLGWHTTQSPVVYLTEQPQVTFREAMKRAGLLAEENLYILFRNESFGIPWYEVAHAAVEKCKSVGAKLLVIDTLPQFAGLIGDSENNSGTALAAIEPLQVAASQGIGVLTISHNRKGGGGLGDSRRGSTAYAGAVDSLCVLQRTEGNGPRNQRLLSAVSRFEGTPEELLIELREDRFHSLGEPGEVAKEQTEQGVLAALPSSQSEALDIHALCKKTKMKRSPLQRVLNTLLGKSLAQTTGKGVRGKPVLYFKDSEE